MMNGYYSFAPGMHSQGCSMGGFGIVSGVLMILFLTALTVLTILFIIRFVKHGVKSRPVPEKPAVQHMNSNALEILNERFAKGEISSEDYQHIRAEILRP